MKRTVTLRPVSVASGWCQTGTIIGGAMKLPASISIPDALASRNTEAFAYYYPPPNVGGELSVLLACEAPPLMSLISRVRIMADVDYAQQGPNNWYEPPANAHLPRFTLTLRKRDKSAVLDLYSWTVSGADVAARNLNYNSPSGSYLGPKAISYEMSAHPDGGPWTVEDLLQSNLAAGWKVTVAAPAYLNSQGTNFHARVVNWWIEADLEDVGGFIANIRHAMSIALRLMRRTRSTIEYRQTAAAQPSPAIGSYAGWKPVSGLGRVELLSDPSRGWGERTLELRAASAIQETYHLADVEVTRRLFDRRNFSCLAWAQYQASAAWSPELNGLAYLDRGQGFTHSRAQDAWSRRGGDGALVRVPSGFPSLSVSGLACCSSLEAARDTERCLMNVNLMDGSWSTVGASGGATVALDSTARMADEQGYDGAAIFSYPAGGGTVRRHQVIGAIPMTGGLVAHVRVGARTSRGDSTGQAFGWRLYRTGSRGSVGYTEHWDPTGRQWVAPEGAVGELSAPSVYAEDACDSIPCDAPLDDADPNYGIVVGRFSNAYDVEFTGALVSVQVADGAHNRFSRPPLVTLGSTILRVGDEHSISMAGGREVWDSRRGCAVATISPWWASGRAVDGMRMPILRAQFAAEAYDELCLSVESGEVVARFDRVRPGGSKTVAAALPAFSVGAELRLWCRWLDADGWGEFGPACISVGGYLVGGAGGPVEAHLRSGSVDAVANGGSLHVGHDGAGHGAEGYLASFETHRDIYSADEMVWRLP